MKNIHFMILLAVFAFIACVSAKPEQVELSSSALPPGEALTAYFKTDKKPEQVKVTLGGQIADLITVQSGSVDFLVPDLPPGRSPLNIYFGDRLVANDSLQVLPHPSRKIVFGYINGEVKKISEKPSNDEPSITDNQPGPKLQFELMNKEDSLLSSGFVPHPAGGVELFDDPGGKIKREEGDSMHGSTFSVTIPNKPAGTMKLNFYEIPTGGLPVHAPANLLFDSRRKLVAQITL